jgi:hypothetical protein
MVLDSFVWVKTKVHDWLNLHGASQKERKEKTLFRQDNRIDRIF